ncbi:TPA: helix-turn-helix transcriptional regulator [Vibrio parahaemolyticus]
MIGSVLKEVRTLKNLSQPDIAKLVGVTKQTYLKWENDVTEPKATQVNKLAEVLGISANEICAGKLEVLILDLLLCEFGNKCLITISFLRV